MEADAAERPGDRASLLRVIDLVLAVWVGFGCLLFALIAGWYSDSAARALQLLLVTLPILVFARVQARFAPLHVPASTVGYTILAAIAVSALYVHTGVESLLVAPLLPLAAVLPYLAGARLRAFMVVALLVELVVVLVFYLLPREEQLVARVAIGLATIVATVALSAAMIRAYADRLKRLVGEANASAQRARQVAEIIPQMVFVAGSGGRIEGTNVRWVEYTGLSPSAALQPPFLSALHAEDRALVARRWESSIQSGRDFEAELRVRRRDGAFRWHLARAVALRDDDGAVGHWFGTFTDIDDQKRAQGTLTFLSEASAALGAAFDAKQALKVLATLAVPQLGDWCVVYLLDDERNARPVAVATPNEANAARALQTLQRFPLRPIPHQPLYDQLAAGRAVLASEVDDDTLSQMAQGPELLQLLRVAGITSAMVVPLFARGEMIGVLSLLSVGSGRRFEEADLAIAKELASRAAKAVEHAQLYEDAQSGIRARDEFLSVASHELKTPLTPLQLNVRTLQRMLAEGVAKTGRPERFASRLESISRQVTRLQKLIDELLDVTRLGGRLLPLEPVALDLVDVVKDVAARFRPVIEQARCELRIGASEPVEGRWDRGRLDQVVMNLLSNAVKFGAGYPVEISISARGEEAILSVEDHGIGIAAADQERIFQRFERGVSQRHFGGLGLGLWIVRQIVTAMDGSVDVHSVPGEGSRFTVTLPRNLQQVAGTEPARLAPVH